jgi:hypothetical protein
MNSQKKGGDRAQERTEWRGGWIDYTHGTKIVKAGINEFQGSLRFIPLEAESQSPPEDLAILLARLQINS